MIAPSRFVVAGVVVGGVLLVVGGIFYFRQLSQTSSKVEEKQSEIEKLNKINAQLSIYVTDSQKKLAEISEKYSTTKKQLEDKSKEFDSLKIKYDELEKAKERKIKGGLHASENPNRRPSAKPPRVHPDPHVTPSPVVPPLPPINKVPDSPGVKEINWEKRTKIAEEILDTERSYVNSLTIMLEVFFKQFNAHASEPDSFLSSNDVKNIFSCAEIILSYNRELLNNLEIVLKNWDPKLSKIGEVFSSMVDFLKIYSAYVSNYTTALNTLEKCKKDPQFLQMLQEAEKDQRLKNMPLSGFLIMPVQRIPRYLMLIRELLKYTPPDHIDYDSLSKTQDRIATVALEVNEAERIASNLQTVYQIQRVFGPQIETIVEPHRRLVKHGKVTLIEKNHKKNRKEAYLILFNDMVILAKQKGDGLDKLVKTPKIDDIDPMEEGTSKVILQIDIAKVTLMMEGEVQFILKTDKNKFLFEFENQNKLIEWSSKFQETKDKYTERLPKT